MWMTVVVLTITVIRYNIHVHVHVLYIHTPLCKIIFLCGTDQGRLQMLYSILFLYLPIGTVMVQLQCIHTYQISVNWATIDHNIIDKNGR